MLDNCFQHFHMADDVMTHHVHVRNLAAKCKSSVFARDNQVQPTTEYLSFVTAIEFYGNVHLLCMLTSDFLTPVLDVCTY